MSLKAVDLSMAVHKNTEVGMLQRELQHKPVSDQAALAHNSLKNSDESRQKAAKLEENDKSKIRDQKSRSSDNRPTKGQAGKGASTAPADMESKPESIHPYKGQHIDLSL